MKYSKPLYLLLLLLLPVTVSGQSRNKMLTIQVSSTVDDDLSGQKITLTQTDYQVSYGNLKLSADGSCSLKAYAGNHNLSIEREGFNSLSYDFTIGEDETEKVVTVTLTEQTRTPFALTSKIVHNVFDGTNDMELSWNTEAPAFFDDFESYSPFAITFGEWTGIDADLEAAAPLVGSYPNRGVMQYAQIINPLAVDPTWWYDYPILRPYSGQQYVGFTRTSSGNANDDWLISPAITVGTDNVLQFMGKAADQFPERFMVYVCELSDSKQGDKQEDFTRIDKDNYETADYRGWHQYSYDLSEYAGKQIKFAIRYISHYNRYGSFMLMIDDVYVGQPYETDGARALKSRKSLTSQRVASPKSPANPNEYFRIYLDGERTGLTYGYSYTLRNVAAGSHTVGVKAFYLEAESELATIQVEVPSKDNYAHVTFVVETNSLLGADGQKLSITSLGTSESYEVTVADGKAEFASLPLGQYVVNIAEGAFQEYQQTITVSEDATVSIVLSDHIITPYNITATMTDDDPSGIPVYVLRWNQELSFYDSFEDYDDFATGAFGEWLSIDRDQQPVYPIALGSQSNIVSFPGSGTATNPTAIAPMVFNPWHTIPSMLPTDPAIKAPTGDKTVIFFSPQRVQADKWLISPLLEIHDNYVLNVTAKGYTSMYPETMEFCVSDGSTQPDDFTALTSVNPLSSDQWTIYQTDLSAYAGQHVRLAVHYTSTDAFLAQIDDFTVGPEDGQGEVISYGNVLRFDISIDGQKIGESTEPVFTLPPLTDGQHTVGIKAIYKNGESEEATYVIDVTTGIAVVRSDLVPDGALSDVPAYYNLQGQRVTNLRHSSIYLVKQNGKTKKIMK